MKELRVVAADDSPLIRDYLEVALSKKIAGANLVGLAANGEEALSMIRLLRPDVVVLDMCMPLKSGIEVLREVRREESEVIIIMFTSDSTPELRKRCLESGANYFVNKSDFRILTDILTQLSNQSCVSGPTVNVLKTTYQHF